MDSLSRNEEIIDDSLLNYYNPPLTEATVFTNRDAVSRDHAYANIHSSSANYYPTSSSSSYISYQDPSSYNSIETIHNEVYGPFLTMKSRYQRKGFDDDYYATVTPNSPLKVDFSKYQNSPPLVTSSSSNAERDHGGVLYSWK